MITGNVRFSAPIRAQYHYGEQSLPPSGRLRASQDGAPRAFARANVADGAGPDPVPEAAEGRSLDARPATGVTSCTNSCATSHG